MGLINIIKTIKEVHKTAIVIVKIGSFCHVYDKDAFVISYLFDYQLKEFEKVSMCGFPLSSLNKIMAKLEHNKIDYLVVDRKYSYEVNEIVKNKNLNQYEKYYEKAKKYVMTKIRIDSIYHFLLDNIESPSGKEIIKQIEDILDEKRKISSN